LNVPQILYVVDAFTDQPFAGNPAAVCVTAEAVDETWMKLVAREMNLSETAFAHPIEGGHSLRWLTPSVEVALCGHATLASALVLWETQGFPENETIRFHTKSGWLTCRKVGGMIEMDFPAKGTTACSAPEGLAASLGCQPVAVASNGMDYLVEVGSETTLRKLSPNMASLATLPVRGVIVTARSDDSRYDFVSRFFAPAAGVNEDPVTGSAHCALAPYWQAKLGKSEMTGYQASERGGVVHTVVKGDRVLLRGNAVLMSRVELTPLGTSPRSGDSREHSH
jgi:PhzF family phenazine biosynthesis protein